MADPTNQDIARILEQIAELLEAQGANPHRVRAYRQGAESLLQAGEQAAGLIRQGKTDRLIELPGIGERLAAVITEVVETGRSNLLDELRAESSPGAVFMQIPGVGPELAERIATELDIHTLEELGQAAHDGRLEQVPGLGPRRIEGIRASLAERLTAASRRRAEQGRQAQASSRPPVHLLLAVDREYREKAAANELRKIAPRRFNPNKEAWLPVYNVRREGWEFTALFSNTAKAHELKKTQDWVVIYYRKGDGEESQSTVVTEVSGPLKGKRVVRGRETETRRYYEQQEA